MTGIPTRRRRLTVGSSLRRYEKPIRWGVGFSTARGVVRRVAAVPLSQIRLLNMAPSGKWMMCILLLSGPLVAWVASISRLDPGR